MDIIMYNELSQVLCMHALFYKVSMTYKDMNPNIEPNTSTEEIEQAKIRQLDNIVKWYKAMQVGDKIHLSIKRYDLQLRNMLQQ